MLESLKEALAANWKGALVGAVVAAAILLGLPSNLVLKVNNMFSDEDPLAKLCAEYEAPAPKPSEEAPAPAPADAGVKAPAADAGDADAGVAADAAAKAD